MPARRWLPLAAALLLPASAAAQPAVAAPPRTAQDSIRASILRGAQGFERGDPSLILDHYDPSIVLSYPGEPDMDLATLRRAYEGLRDRPRTVVARTVPTFDEILVSGDLAIVRVRWATTIADTAAGRTTARRLKDMQVWRRRADGRWLFVRGMHYPEPAPADSSRAAPADTARAAGDRWALPDATWFVEGIARDSARGRWLLTSVARGGVLATADGRRFERLAVEGADRWSTLGLSVDAARGLVWVTTAALPAHRAYAAADSGATALLAVELRSGRVVRRVAPPTDGRKRMLGDVLAAPDGTVYVSDGAGGTLYRLAPESDTLAALAELRSPQGIVLAPDGRALLVATYGAGIVRVELATGASRRLPVLDAAADGALSGLRGVDGLARHGRSLFAVQNGTAVERVLRLDLDERGEAIAAVVVCRSGPAELEEPTNGVVADGRFVWVARSMWDRLDRTLRADPAKPWSPSEVRSLDVRGDAACGLGREG